jgi:hypothetical protein
MESMAFAFPVKPGKAQEWRDRGREFRGARRNEYLAFRRRLAPAAYTGPLRGLWFDQPSLEALSVLAFDAQSLEDDEARDSSMRAVGP